VLKKWKHDKGGYFLKIGIPRALLYYDYFPMWETFFKKLGHEIVVSSSTQKNIVNHGIAFCVDDACFPVKLFHGHVADLIGKVDMVFIPRLISINQEEFICPKFIGLPEMIKSSINGLPPIIILDLNLYKSRQDLIKAYIDLGKKVGATSREAILAFREAALAQERYESMLKSGKTPLDIIEPKNDKGERVNDNRTIAVIGHPYLIFDRHASMNIIDKIRQKGYDVIVPENVSDGQIEESVSFLPKKLFWSYGKRLLGSSIFLLKNRKVEGMIFVSSFGCGIDSFMGELIQRFNEREWKIPYTVITLDEHTGEAGFETRLEAFLDMIKWREKDDNYISSHGASLYIY